MIGDTPPDYLLFSDVVDGKLEMLPGLSSRPAVIAYLKVAAAITDADPGEETRFLLQTSRFGGCRGGRRRVPGICPGLRWRIAQGGGAVQCGEGASADYRSENAGRAAQRLCVLLGVCGTAADAEFLAGLLRQSPLPERTAAAFGGLLAGYVMLDPRSGWPFLAAVLADEKPRLRRPPRRPRRRPLFPGCPHRSEQTRLSAVRAALLPHGDLADQAVEDLRRWGYWNLTREVLAQFAKPTHAAPIVKRSIVRYALSCPDDDAKAFIAALRQTDPKLVREVEERLARYAPKK